jgi:hypothetical protein
LERKVLDSCENSGTGETPQAKPRRLTARPAESEPPGAEINHYYLGIGIPYRNYKMNWLIKDDNQVSKKILKQLILV